LSFPLVAALVWFVQSKVNAVFGREVEISGKFSGKEIAVSAIGVGV
jgi:hypothetical protein